MPRIVHIGSLVAAAKPAEIDPLATEWVLLTSGTSGVPKAVLNFVRALNLSGAGKVTRRDA